MIDGGFVENLKKVVSDMNEKSNIIVVKQIAFFCVLATVLGFIYG